MCCNHQANEKLISISLEVSALFGTGCAKYCISSIYVISSNIAILMRCKKSGKIQIFSDRMNAQTSKLHGIIYTLMTLNNKSFFQ